MSAAMLAYWDERGQHAASRDQIRISCALWSEKWAGRSLGDVTPDRLDAFVRSLESAGYRGSTLDRIVRDGRTAFNWARKRGRVIAAPFVPGVQTAADRDAAPPKGRPLTIPDLARAFDLAWPVEHLRLFVLLASNTLARPGAALFDLTTWQYDREAQILDTNPPGRKQTKKRRPIVPVSRTLRPWLETAEAGYLIRWNGAKVASVKGVWRRRVQAALGPDVEPYSIRHGMARELRRRGVPADELEIMMGHRVPTGQSRVTAGYAPYDPSYCRRAVALIDEIHQEIQVRCSVARFTGLSPEEAGAAGVN